MKLSSLGSEPSERIVINGVSYINHGRDVERAQHPPYKKKEGSKAIIPFTQTFKQTTLKRFLFDSPFESFF